MGAGRGVKMSKSNHKELYRFQMLLKEDVFNFLISWSTHIVKIGERKNDILRWPFEIASKPVQLILPIYAQMGHINHTG